MRKDICLGELCFSHTLIPVGALAILSEELRCLAKSGALETVANFVFCHLFCIRSFAGPLWVGN
jgi:hypothetical protein